MKKSLLCTWVYVAPRMGSEKDQVVYTSKDPIGDYIEWGKGSNQGQRTDLMHCKDIIDMGGSMRDCFEEHFGTLIRYHGGFAKYIDIRNMQEAVPTRVLDVSIVWGYPGTGKSYSAYQFDPNLYSKPLGEGEAKWWDDYDGQTTILFDDFTGQISIQV